MAPQHSPLPAGRPDSPSGLDMTKSGVLSAKKDFLVPTKGECFGKLHGEGLSPVKLAEACPEQIKGTALLTGLIDQERSIESCRVRRLQ